MEEKFWQDWQNFWRLSKFLNENDEMEEIDRMKNLHQMLKIFLRLEKFEKNLFFSQKIFAAELELENHFEKQKMRLKKMSEKIETQKNYRNRQAQLRENGKIERKRRTHQLILIGVAWQKFCEINRFPENKFENFLKKFSQVAHQRLPIPVSKKYLQKKYEGNDKIIIHNFCKIGGTWESFFKKIFCVGKICARCSKKGTCKKLDPIYFSSFLNFYSPRIFLQ